MLSLQLVFILSEEQIIEYYHMTGNLQCCCALAAAVSTVTVF
jgi:hypothetical protein